MSTRVVVLRAFSVVAMMTMVVSAAGCGGGNLDASEPVDQTDSPLSSPDALDRLIAHLYRVGLGRAVTPTEQSTLRSAYSSGLGCKGLMHRVLGSSEARTYQSHLTNAGFVDYEYEAVTTYDIVHDPNGVKVLLLYRNDRSLIVRQLPELIDTGVPSSHRCTPFGS